MYIYMNKQGIIKIDNNVFYMVTKPNPIQLMVRTTFEELSSKIKEDHCDVCGDTLEDGDLTRMKTNFGKYIYFCDCCYNYQTE
jgi:hypothetical protein